MADCTCEVFSDGHRRACQHFARTPEEGRIKVLETALRELVEKAEIALLYARHVPGCGFNLGGKYHNEICQCGLMRRLPGITQAITKAKALLPKEKAGEFPK